MRQGCRFIMRQGCCFIMRQGCRIYLNIENRENPVQAYSLFAKTLISAALLVGSTSTAFSAPCQYNQIKAQYQISVEKAHASSQWQFNLWRNDAQVAHQNLDKQISELWYRAKNDRVQLTRMYDNYNRGIEYQSDELSKGTIDWDKKYSLISQQTLDSLKPQQSQTQTESCEQVITLQGHDGVAKISLDWMPKLKLVKQLTIEKPGYKKQWTLQSTNQDSELITAQFKQWLNFRTTDYADIGDMENDKFLQKMINMGFTEQQNHGHGGHGHSH